MRITVWEHEKVLVSINPAHFHNEVELLKALSVQRYRGMAEVAFSLVIPATKNQKYMKEWVTPAGEVRLAQNDE